MRAKDGTITEFDPPGSIGTFMSEGGCINPAGLIVGVYLDAGFVPHGFVPEERLKAYVGSPRYDALP